MTTSDGNCSYTQMFEKSVDLSDFNTLGVAAKANLFAEITDKFQLTDLAASGFFDHKNWFVFGGGSNVLFKSDLNRPVMRMAISGIQVTDESENEIIVRVGAGEVWHRVVEWAVKRNYGGIENLALIPGTAGAAPIQNIGAYGAELADVFEELEFFDTRTKQFQKLTKEKCEFGYRDSIFKNELKGKAIITSITLRLTNVSSHTVNSSYASLEEYLEKRGIESPKIQDVFDAVVAVRTSKLPDPAMIGNAGSFFKNPVIGLDMHQTLIDNFPEMPSYKLEDESFKIPAGWLIDKAGWKGKKIGNVGCYKNQALVIVNHGGATGKEILEFAGMIQKSVKEKFGIDLVPEVNIIE
jgi:UDP-N-acetylmuramate dehydrogenase